MARLIAKTPCAGLLPVCVNGTTLSELTPAAVTSVMPGRDADLSMFKNATGCTFPTPNRTTGKEAARAIWTGPSQCLFVGPEIGDLPGFATTDQSDGWAVMRLEGADIEQIMARLTAIDMRRTVIKRGHTARTQLGHMQLSITRTGENRFDLLVFRSMAQTAIHEIATVMQNLSKRPELS